MVAAPGPSLTAADAEAITRARAADAVRVVAVNDAFRLLPTADLLYACDARWWDTHAGVPAFAGERWTQDTNKGVEAGRRWGLNVVRSERTDRPLLDGDAIGQGFNSGFQAVNLAALMGADRIVLVGFDMGLAEDGTSHFFGDHPGKLNVLSPYAMFIAAFEAAAPCYAEAGVEVLNASRRTALKCFPLIPLERVLA